MDLTKKETRAWMVLRYGLGCLWLTAGLLQMQPGMFHPAFYGNLPSSVMPSALQIVKEGTVGWMEPVVSFTQSLFIHMPVITNLFIIAMQLTLAVMLLSPLPSRVVRLGAILSVAWGLAVWVFGEGLGGLFSLGDMTFYEGFPGSALLYALAGGLLYCPSRLWLRGTCQRWLLYAVSGVFTISAILQALPENGQWSVKGLLDVFANSGVQRQPSVFSAPIMHFTTVISLYPIAVNGVLLILLALAAVIVFAWETMPKGVRYFVFLWLLWTWWFGQDFGDLFSGLSTDLNTAAILGVLLVSAGSNADEAGIGSSGVREAR